MHTYIHTCIHTNKRTYKHTYIDPSAAAAAYVRLGGEADGGDTHRGKLPLRERLGAGAPDAKLAHLSDAALEEVSVRVSICLSICLSLSLSVCMYVCVCIYIYIYIYT